MHWLHPDLARRDLDSGGAGVFAMAPIEQGELLTVWGGRAATWAELQHVGDAQRTHAIQVHWDVFLVPDEPLHAADYFNHSCAPNAGFSCSVTLVAMRRIEAGEQVSFDYAMSDSASYDEFDCGCGAASCRGKVRASDWRDPELQRRYRGYFSSYLQRAMTSADAPGACAGPTHPAGQRRSVADPGGAAID